MAANGDRKTMKRLSTQLGLVQSKRKTAEEHECLRHIFLLKPQLGSSKLRLPELHEQRAAGPRKRASSELLRSTSSIKGPSSSSSNAATQRMVQLAHNGAYWHKLMTHDIEVTLHVESRMTISWKEVQDANTRVQVLRAGVCHITQYPLVYEEDEIEVQSHPQGEDGQVEELEIIFTSLIEQHGADVEKLRDVSGAALVHCLVLANNDRSIRLAMRLFKLRPALLLCTHHNGRKCKHQHGKPEEYEEDPSFNGEGSLHILAVNRWEQEFKELVELAHKELSSADNQFEELLMQKCTGTFFQANAQHLGSTPLAYAAWFGLESVFLRLFVDTAESKALLTPGQQMLVLNGVSENKGIAPAPLDAQTLARLNGNGQRPALLDANGYNGHYPIHAVVDSDNTKMYDLLVDRCGALSMQAERCPLTGPEQLTPLQLAAKLGRKKMFRHILKKRTKPVWKWGPLAEYEIPVDEIDSADSKGRFTVMEILVAPGDKDANPGQVMLLDEFMNGFLYKQYVTKWDSGIKNIFLQRLTVIIFYVICVSQLAAPSIVPISMPLFSLRRGMAGEPVFLGEQPLLTVANLLFTCFLLSEELREILFSILPDEDELVKRKLTCLQVLRQTGDRIVERGGRLLLMSTLASFVGCVGLLSEEPSIARERGWVRVALALAGSSAWVVLLAQVSFLFHSLRVFVSVVDSTLRNDVGKFVYVFVPLLFGFSTGINSLMQLQPVWSTRWGSWWLTLENLLLLSFIQEPPVVADEDLPSPSSVVLLLGDFQAYGSDSFLPAILFYVFFVLYLVVSVVLLINLLIAMMSARFEEQNRNATLDTRVAFCRLVLRIERLLETSTRFQRWWMREKDAGAGTNTALGGSSKSVASQPPSHRSSMLLGKSIANDASERVEGDSQDKRADAAELETSTHDAPGDVSAQPFEKRSLSRRISQRTSKALFGDKNKTQIKKEEQRFIQFIQGKSSTNPMDSGMHNIFDEGEEDNKRSVNDQLRTISQKLETLLSEKQEPSPSERWQRAAAEAAHQAAVDMVRARSAHQEQTKAFRTIVEQLLAAKGAEQGMDAVKKQLEVVDAAMVKTQSAMIVAGEGIREAAKAAGHGHSSDHRQAMEATPEPVTLAIDRLRTLTKKIGVSEEAAFNSYVSRTLQARAEKAAKRGFVSFIDWPQNHAPFISHGTYSGRPRANDMRHCLPASELRSFLGDLFGTDSTPNSDIEKLPNEFISMLAAALDQNGDGFINLSQLFDRWSLFFGGPRNLQHKTPAPAQEAPSAELPIIGRIHSQSLPANLPTGQARDGSIMVSDHV